MQVIRIEFHVHTVLSPCAEVEMIPPLIVLETIDRGIDVIAITDHNSISNIEAVQKSACNTDLLVLAGLELTTKEDIHLLCIFDGLPKTKQFYSIVYPLMPATLNNPELFGEQFVVDETGEFIENEKRLLLSATNITINQAVDEVHRQGGLAIAAHIDRKSNGLLEVLGFPPEKVKFDAMEISMNINLDIAYKKYPSIKNQQLIQSGDAHRLNEIIGKNKLVVEKKNFKEISEALHNKRLTIME
jgi:predicted metal-dependent phosphoesterase TrpH